MFNQEKVINYRQRWLDVQKNVIDELTGEYRERSDYEEYEADHANSEWMRTI